MDSDSGQEALREVLAAMSEPLRAVFVDAGLRARGTLDRENGWVQQLRAAVDFLAPYPGVTWPFSDIFWIRLQGVLTEIRVATLEKLDAAAECGIDPRPIRGVLAACDALRNALSDDELIFIDWCRQRAAHVYQKGFALSLRPKNDTLKDARHIAVLDRPVQIAEIDAAIRRTLGPETSTFPIACRLAARIQPQVHWLDQAHAHFVGRPTP